MIENQEKVPVVFISYCWTSIEHENWVLNLAGKLVSKSGVEVILDKWDLNYGHDRFHFMESSIKKADKVLVICDEKYCEKANNRESGVGTEVQIITPDVYLNTNQEKFIPISLVENNGVFLLPDFFKSRYALGMIKAEEFEEDYKKLERLIWGEPLFKRPVRGKKPNFDLSKEVQIEPEIAVREKKPNFDLFKEVQMKSENVKQIVDDEDEERVVWLLPRGFLLFTDITYLNIESWSVVASYYDYDGECQHSTHYHDSYSIWWNREIKVQFRKLCIPEADWGWGRAPLNFLTRLREVKQKIDIREEVEKEKLHDYPIYYYKPGEAIFLPEVPKEYKFYYETGALRDFLEEISDIENGSLSRDTLIQKALTIRQSVYLECRSYLGEDHPSFLFIKEILDNFDKSHSSPDLLKWFGELKSILANTLNYERDVWSKQLKKKHY